jgi:hypothetical protein
MAGLDRLDPAIQGNVLRPSNFLPLDGRREGNDWRSRNMTAE